MKNTASDLAGLPYDPLSMASLQLWKQENQEDNRPRIERLLRNLPLAMEEELTPRQRQIMRMRYSRNMSVTRIAQELGINKATVSRTLSRSTWKLYRSLRYSLEKNLHFPRKSLDFSGENLIMPILYARFIWDLCLSGGQVVPCEIEGKD